MKSGDEVIFGAAHLRKNYGPVRALLDASLTVRPGEVHALLGENGAGKSTLIRIAAGLTLPDDGVISVRGKKFSPDSTLAAIANGVRVVGQDFSLSPNISVLENLCLGSPGFLYRTSRKGFFPWKAARRFAAERLQEFGVSIDPQRLVSSLSVSERQLVALVRGTLDNPSVVFLDEPSSALDQQGVEVLYGLVRTLRSNGVAVVYVSHKLEEVFDLADRITIMRDGKTVLDGTPASEMSVRDVTSTMVGRDIAQLFPPRIGKRSAEPLLQVSGLNAPRIHDISFSVRRGEILGIGGLIGSGRTELARAITGLAPIKSGEIRMQGQPVERLNRKQAIKLGFEYVTEDRLGEGLVSNRPIRENVAGRILAKFVRGPFLRHGDIERFARKQMTTFSIAARDPSTEVRTLSGGNQQKTLLASALASNPKVVFFDEPTRGIDIGAKSQIYSLIREMSADRAIVLISAELIELMGMADRILIMREGRIAGEFAGSEATEQNLIAAAIGHQ